MRFYEVTKRAMDLIVSFVALALFSPLFIILAVLIKLESPGPVFFRQQRLGVNGKLFRIYKLRSMHKDAEERLREDPILYQDYVRNGFKLPEGKDPRVSKVGSFLRKSSLDELPQLINVLTGDMSLVGPRPVIAAELQEYGDLKDEFLSAKPGMTGYWQVSGR